MIRTALTVVALGGPTAAAAAADRYTGYWVSDANGHRGPLKATVSPSADGYSVRYTGRFAGVIPFAYRSPMTVVGTTPDGVVLSAERRLFLFGTFRTEGVLTPSSFDATFTSGRDRGRFVLSR